MKKFFQEFKKFITRGNIVDMAVGVIVGSSFTAIVNGLSNFILKPLINALLSLILGGGALDKVYTYLVPAYDVNGEIDLTKSIYIDWGSFINSVINFFIVAFVLFSIVKVINSVREGRKKLDFDARNGRPSKEDRKEMKKRGIKFSDADAVADFYEERHRGKLAQRLPLKKRQDLKRKQILQQRIFSKRFATFLKTRNNEKLTERAAAKLAAAFNYSLL